MKLKLIAPRCHAEEAVNPFPPYVLLTLAALTPNDVEVIIEDENVEALCLNDEVDLVGITVITQTANRAFQIGDQYKGRGITVLMGGVFAEACPDDCLKHADTVILSEAEDIWQNIIDDFRRGCLKQIYESPVRPKLNNRPLPRHDLIADKKGYFSHNLVMISRGCPNRCEYCSSGVHWKGQIKTRPVEDIIREIELLAPKQPLLFIDDNLIWEKSFAENLFKALIPLKRQWICCGACIDSVDDIELVKLAKESGCLSILFGFETVIKKL